ncbi:MAG: aspartate 1-decarboxylase [Rhizobiaceae bacterium]|nr:aspartate 1-decarboxylase [Rhizobiaceae bacterium]
MKQFVASKLHGIYVTEANLNYHGSITLDPDHCEAVGLQPLEFVDIWNKNSGARISTYVIYGERGSKVCILNGAAARTCQKGDQVIICGSEYRPTGEVFDMTPKILTFNEDNSIADRLSYVVKKDEHGKVDFQILDEKSRPLPVPLLEGEESSLEPTI